MQRILFYERDEAFRSYVHQTILNKANKCGEGAQSDLSEPELDLSGELDSVSYMFHHLVLTFSYLNAEYSTPTHVICQNDFKVVMRQPMDDVLFFACSSATNNGMSILEIHHTSLTFQYTVYDESFPKLIEIYCFSYISLSNLFR